MTRRLPWLLAGIVVLAEVPYPLVHGQPRNALTILAVLAFFATSVTSAAVSRGPAAAVGLVVVAAGIGLLVEAVGTRTGFPFGRYAYAHTLGWSLLGVPVVIPLAWAMMAYPAVLVARRIASGRGLRALVGGVALASWDLFLDPQMVRAGHWRWLAVGVHLPGVPDVPVSNFLGWLGVAVVVVALLDRLLPPGRGADGPPIALYYWTYASSVLANLAFFGRPWVALWGGLAMGAVVVLLARTSQRLPAAAW